MTKTSNRESHGKALSRVESKGSRKVSPRGAKKKRAAKGAKRVASPKVAASKSVKVASSEVALVPVELAKQPNERSPESRPKRRSSEGSSGREKSQNRQKWGKVTWDAGWTGIPTVLLDCQHRLGISAQELAVLLQLLKRWWEIGKHPYPSREEIAGATGMSVRTVQRHIDSLVTAGYVKRKRRRLNGGYTSNSYSFEGLVEALEPLAREKIEKRKEAQAQDSPERAISKRRARRTKGSSS